MNKKELIDIVSLKKDLTKKGYNMAGVGKLLKQAQKMQKAMEAVQTELANTTVEGSAAGGAVKAVVNGQGVLQSIKLDPEFLKEDVASVEASIVAAVEDAASKARAKSEVQMNKIPGGFSIPGLI